MAEAVSTARWRQHPSGRTLPDTESAAMAEVAGAVVLVGGYCEGEVEEEGEECAEDEEDFDDVLKSYAYSAADARWVQTVHREVPHLEGHAMVSFGAFALLHGGSDADYEVRCESYLLTVNAGSTATAVAPLATQGAAPQRMRHGACRWRDTLVVFGGQNDDGLYNDLFMLRREGGDATAGWGWVDVPARSALPPPRSLTVLSAVDAHDASDVPSLALFGGAYTTNADQRSLGDLWLFSAGVWREVPLAGVPPRNGHVGGVVAGTLTMLIMAGAAGAGAGGGEDGSYDDRPMLLDLENGSVRYLPVDPAAAPSTRYMPAGAFRVAAARAFLLATGTKRLPGPNDVFELSLESGLP